MGTMTKTGIVKSDLASSTVAPNEEETKIDLGKLQEAEMGIKPTKEDDVVLTNPGSATSSASANGADGEIISNPGTGEKSEVGIAENKPTKEDDVVLTNPGSATSSASANGADGEIISNPGTGEKSEVGIADSNANFGVESSKAAVDTKDDEGITSDSETLVNPVATASDTHAKSNDSSLPVQADTSNEDTGTTTDLETATAEEDDPEDKNTEDNQCTRL